MKFSRWHLGINSFWHQLGSSLEFSRWHLVINYVWRQIGSPLGFTIPRYSFSGIPPCFPPLRFTLLICPCGTTYFPVGDLLYFSFIGELHDVLYISYYNNIKTWMKYCACWDYNCLLRWFFFSNTNYCFLL